MPAITFRLKREIETDRDILRDNWEKEGKTKEE